MSAKMEGSFLYLMRNRPRLTSGWLDIEKNWSYSDGVVIYNNKEHVTLRRIQEGIRFG
jgi:hypothetical protein